MPFYPADSITKWVYTVIEERYDNAEQDERQKIRNMIYETNMGIHDPTLSTYIEEDIIQEEIMLDSLADAIMNTIEVDDVREMMKEYIEEDDKSD
jgi:hypothetical protein